LGNDTDLEHDALTAVLVTQPLHGSVVLSANGRFTYTPQTNFHGSDSFTYRANDVRSSSAPAAVTISVGPVNDPPVANGDSYGTGAALPLAVAAPGILGNDNDVDGDPLTAVVVSGPANGSLTLNGDGGLTYAPNAGFGGVDGFTYRVNDGVANSNTASVSITVDSMSLIHVGDLDRMSGAEASGWWAQATVRVHSAKHGAVAGAVVTGTWSDGALGTAQCTTNSSGYCSLNKSGISPSVLSVAFRSTMSPRRAASMRVAPITTPMAIAPERQRQSAHRSSFMSATSTARAAPMRRDRGHRSPSACTAPPMVPWLEQSSREPGAARPPGRRSARPMPPATAF
jgi:hypothetical protein